MVPGPPRQDFWLLWAGSTVSNLGDGVRLVALPLLTVSVTTDPLAVGAVTAATFLPWLLLSLVGGAVADRVDRRRLILLGQVVRGLAVAILAVLVWNGEVALVVIYLIAFIIGAGEVVVDSAMQAAIPQVAGSDLDTANSRLASAQFVAGELLGGPVGGGLYAVSASLPFVFDAITFGLGAVLIGVITTPLQESTPQVAVGTERASLIADITEGARFLIDQPVLRGITIAVSLANLADSAASALLVLLVVELLAGSEIAFGLIIAAGAVGGLLGSLTAARVVRVFGRRPALVGSFVSMAVAQAVLAAAPNLLLVGVASFVVLFAIAQFNVSGQSIRQRMTPDRLLGRVIASMRFVGMGAIPLGGLGGGLVARAIGVRETIAIAAAISAVATVAIVRATAGHDLESVAEPESDRP